MCFSAFYSFEDAAHKLYKKTKETMLLPNRKIFPLLALTSACIGSTAIGAGANLLFIVDESGSMEGEHLFLQTQAPSIESGLNAVGITDLNFGLVGYGDDNDVPRLINLNAAGALGNASEFSAAAATLRTDGGFEDGYAGIDFGLDQFSGETGASFYILVTDEDRDVLNDSDYPGASSLTPASIQQSLSNANARLVSILDQEILDNQSAEALVINANNQTFTADGSGDVERKENGEFGSQADGSTTSDYAQLSLDSGGIVADLNQLREGGLTADSFTLAFIDSLIDIVLINTGGNLAQLAENENQLAVAGLIASKIQNTDGSESFFSSLLALDVVQQRLLLRLAELQGMQQVGNTLIGGALSYTFAMDDHFTVTSRQSRNLNAIEDSEAGEFRKWNVFFQAVANDADISATSSTVSGDSDNFGGLAGIDYRWDANLVTGVALGYKNDDLKYSNFSESEINTSSIIGYSSWMLIDGLSLEGTLGYASSDVETTRKTSLLSGIASDASAETDTDTFSASIGVRYAFEAKSFTVTPHARLQLARVEVDGYQENGGGAFAATVDDYDVNSVQSILGFRASTELTVGDFELIPHLGAEWIHEFDDDGTLVDTTLANEPLQITTTRRDSDYGRAILGGTLKLNEDTAIMLSALQSFGADSMDTTSFRLSVHRAF
jgi:outer membrane autotransporter protein